MMKRFKNDMILIAGILVLAAIIFIGISIFRKPGNLVEIEVDGVAQKTFELTALNEGKSFTVWQDGNHIIVEESKVSTDAAVPAPGDIEADAARFNTFKIEGGKVQMVEASCPDKLCVHQGAVSSAGENIICLPNKVIITIKGEKSESTPDVIAQ